MIDSGKSVWFYYLQILPFPATVWTLLKLWAFQPKTVALTVVSPVVYSSHRLGIFIHKKRRIILSMATVKQI